jgi:predicted protein tyrosine phosphatase
MMTTEAVGAAGQEVGRTTAVLSVFRPATSGTDLLSETNNRLQALTASREARDCPAMIIVCPLSRIEETVVESGARRMVTLINAGTPVARPAVLGEADHLFLAMNDIIEVLPDMTPPGAEHVEALLEFARDWDRSAPLLIHCFAGISRSTAAAYTVAAALAPKRDEAELARTLRRLSPSATPNSRVIAIADRILGRRGRMVRAIEAIGRGADAMEGIPFRLKIDV